MAKVLENAGERTIEHLDYVGSLSIQWWATLLAMGRAVPFVGNRYRWRTTLRQMLEIGVDAMPMVSLMAICTGFILAMQGASELRRFGALHYVIDLVAVGFTRELGPLLTAIAVSGRSGSAFDGSCDIDYVLSGRLEKLEELDYQGGVKVQVAISAEMTSIATGKPVWNAVSEIGEVKQRDVLAVVSEMNRTMQRAIEKLVTPMPTSLATGAAGGQKDQK
jgi:permease MlaE